MRQRATLESITRWKSGDRVYTLSYRKLAARSRAPEPPRVLGDQISDLLGSRPDISEFEVAEVRRSTETGVFYYSDGEFWLPESKLFDTRAAARHEHARILKMLAKWVRDNQGR